MTKKPETIEEFREYFKNCERDKSAVMFSNRPELTDIFNQLAREGLVVQKIERNVYYVATQYAK